MPKERELLEELLEELTHPKWSLEAFYFRNLVTPKVLSSKNTMQLFKIYMYLGQYG